MHNTPALNTDTPCDPLHILEDPDELSSKTIDTIILALTDKDNFDAALSALATVLLLTPNLAVDIPLSVLDYQPIKQLQVVWESLVRLLLHTKVRPSVTEQLKDKVADGNGWQISASLLKYIFDWFPEELNIDLLRFLSKQDSLSETAAELLERKIIIEGMVHNKTAAAIEPLAHLETKQFRLLVIHNIVDGQGDEIVRLHALVQAFLDKFPNIEIMLFTDRSYLYDHPRVQVVSILESEAFIYALHQKWDGVLNFFEPYLPSNSYNITIEQNLREYLSKDFPFFYIWARKDLNHFTFESIVIDGHEFIQEWQLNRRKFQLNYEPTMRLVEWLDLPIRIGENKPLSRSLAVGNSQENLSALWQSLKGDFENQTGVQDRPIALVNIFGGHHPMKGFEPDDFDQVIEILSLLSNEGFNVVLVPNGEKWGGLQQIQTLLNSLPQDLSLAVAAAPLVHINSPDQVMRAIKYFVHYSDLVVTIEGWMVHLAYSLGKPYRLLMAPYSYTSEWQPYACTVNQKRWIPEREYSRRAQFVLGRERPAKPPNLHYPEKALFQAAIQVWAATGTRPLAEQLLYWLNSPDKDIRAWIISAIAKIDASFFVEILIKALDDPNREVRAAAATALLKSGIDLALRFGANGHKILHAYELIGDFCFQNLKQLGKAACPALKACLNGDDCYVSRDAKIIAKTMQLAELY